MSSHSHQRPILCNSLHIFCQSYLTLYYSLTVRALKVWRPDWTYLGNASNNPVTGFGFSVCFYNEISQINMITVMACSFFSTIFLDFVASGKTWSPGLISMYLRHNIPECTDCFKMHSLHWTWILLCVYQVDKKLLLQLCFCDCFLPRFIFHIPIFINGERKMQRSKDPALSSLLILELYQGYTEQPCFKPWTYELMILWNPTLTVIIM